MSEPKDVRELADAAASLLRRVRPDDGGDDALIAAALLAGRARHRASSRRRVLGAAAIGGALAASIGLAIVLGLGDRATHEQAHAPAARTTLTRLTLADAHRLLATSDARFEVRSAGSVRVVRLERGAVLFDVAPLASNEGFEVHTPSARVIVTGTVFAVEVASPGVAVEVFEGHVRVEENGVVRSLGPGERYGPTGEGLALLRTEGRDAARQRSARAAASAVASSVPAPAPVEPAPARAAPSTRRALGPADVRALILAGHAERALALARRHESGGEWRYVEGDALRALARPDEAATAYEVAARELARPEREEAAFLAARIRLRELSDPAGALAALDTGGVDAGDSALHERGLVLRADALGQLGRSEALREVAREYVRDYPLGSSAPRFHRILDAAQVLR